MWREQLAKPPDINTALDAVRPRLFGLAYRMLGSHAAAEDVVQDTMLSFLAQKNVPDNPESWCVRTATNKAIDVLRAEKVRRGNYVGPWLPDPIAEDDLPDAHPGAEENLMLAETVSTALLVVLEQLSPTERAAFLLHDVFDYSYSEIAELIGKAEGNCRQLVSRARRHVQSGKPRFEVSAVDHSAVAQAFMAAVASGDAAAVEKLLADDAVLLSDGGGKVRAALRPLYGPAEIAQVITYVSAHLGDDVSFIPTTMNGLPGVILKEGAHINSATTYVIAEGKVQAIYMVRNPDKLAHLN